MPPKFRLTKEQELEIVERYNNGDSIRKIAEDYPVGRTSIGYVLQRHNVKMKGKGNSYGYTNKKYTINQDYFSEIDTEEKAYWLGFISADGHVSDDGIIIALQIRDNKHLQKFLDAIGSNSNIRYITKEHKIARIEIYSKKIVSDLRCLGFYKDKSKTQTYPSIPEEFHKHFIRGLFDGDGCISIRERNNPRYKGEVDYSISFCGTLETMKTVQDIICKNCNVNINKVHSSNKYLKIIQWSGKQNAKKILDWIYEDSNIELDRKHILYKKHIEGEG
ncbi:hypothetical protein NXG04_07305 [Klebsiella pneumoniae]|nr:hypothetical protein [Klebsiella pneumoniae]MDS7714359.1 hypothetical protein [Klebsiella pneumoniae]